MKSVLNKIKHRQYRPAILLLLLSLNFSLLVTTAYAGLTNNNGQRARTVWQPKRPAGKPPPYRPSSSQGMISHSTTISNKSLQPNSGAGKASSYISSAGAASSEQFVLQSRDISSYAPVWQSFSDYLTVPKGCDKIPLFLTFVNGSNANPRFQDIRVKLAGKALATIKDFGGQAKLMRNLTGAVGVGESLLVVQAYGPSGAQLNWQFTTPKVEVTGVSPKDVALNKPITITGRNFCELASVNQVFFDRTPATIISATRTQLQVKVPPALTGGKADLVVAVGPCKSKAYKITVKSAPKIGSVNMISTAPGQPLTITGEGFSDKSSENQVFVGGLPAEIVSSSPTSITCIVPEPANEGYPTWGVPIKVKTNGVDSVDPENKATINIQSRVFDSTPSR